MAAKKSSSKKKAAIEASFRVDSDFGDQLKEKFKEWSRDDACEKPRHRGGGAGGWVYFLGMVGSAVALLEKSEGFLNGVVALLKALVWPAVLVYRLFTFSQP